MLSQVLAAVVGLGSLALYLAAFFFPEVHRRHDFFWSGVGLFYALVLWVDAAEVTPVQFLGHLASVSLLAWLGWQTLTLRRKRTPLALQTPFSQDSWPTFKQEIMALTQDFLRQTPLGRWLPVNQGAANQPGDSLSSAGLRASSLKDVGYEFLDELELSKPASVKLPPAQESPTYHRDFRLPQPPAAKVGVGQGQVPDAKPANTKPVASVKSKSPRTSATWWQKGPILWAWAAELWGAMTTPKPKKPVIEIPPRPTTPHPEPIPAGQTVSILEGDNARSDGDSGKNDLDRPKTPLPNNQAPPDQAVTILDTESSTRASSEAWMNSPDNEEVNADPLQAQEASSACQDPGAASGPEEAESDP